MAKYHHLVPTVFPALCQRLPAVPSLKTVSGPSIIEAVRPNQGSGYKISIQCQELMRTSGQCHSQFRLHPHMI